MSGTHVIYPTDLQERWGYSKSTLWRLEKDRKLPPRDFFIGGKPVGWKPETIEAHERGEALKTSEALC